MTKFISIAVLLYLMYRLISNGGKFLNMTDNSATANPKKGEYVDYEEVDSKIKD